MLDTLLSDVRFGSRQLRKNPAFTLAAIVTLALGIGANATIFSWLNGVILNPLPHVDSHNMVSVRWRTPEGHGTSFSWPDYVDTRKRVQTMDGLSVASMDPLSLGEGARPERIWGMLVSANYFQSLGVVPVAGRAFRPEEDENPGGHPVTVISHHLWQTKFGGDPKMVGREIRINNRNYTVVGIAPEGFQGSILGLGFELYLPLSMADVVYGTTNQLTQRDSHWLQGQGRLKPGVDARQATADLSGISAQLKQEFSHTDQYSRAELIPIWREGGGALLAPVLLLMMAVTAVVLLIACANVANLLLARGAGRRREIAIRQALGVRRSRLIGQLLVENGILALLGGGAAMAIVPWAGALLMGFAPQTEFPVSLTIHTDATVLLFTLGISVLATLLAGLVPALRASNPDVVTALKDSSNGSIGQRKSWLRNSLVVAQVSLSMVLLVAAGLLLKSLKQASTADPGFDPRNVLVSGVDFGLGGYNIPRGRTALREMIGKVAALPGVAEVSTLRRIPLGLGGSNSTSVAVEGYVPSKNEEMQVFVNTIGPGFFHTARTPLIAGREFTTSDSDTTQHVLIVNQTFAKRYFGRFDPVGRHVKIYGENKVVAGVVRDSKFQTLDEKPTPFVYLPELQIFANDVNFIVRTAGDPMGMARVVEDAIHSVDPALAVYGQRSLESSITAAYFGQRMGGSMLGVFGALALILAAVGLYGVLAYSVTQRSREVGIRMALGAKPADVLRMIIAQGLRLSGIGLAIGLALALATTRLMTSLLFGVSPTDFLTLLVVSALLAFVAMLASFIPAHRATKIDPILAIRQD